MLNKYLFFLLIISAPIISMEVNECTIQINIDGTEALQRKVEVILKRNDIATQVIIRDLLTQEPTKKSSPEQLEQRRLIIRKISESDE